MEMKIELIPLQSKNLEESKQFYTEVMGFHLDHDVRPGNGVRVIQFTPQGSGCSIAIGTGIGTEGAAPVTGIHLVVEDIEAARDGFIARGLDISEVNDMGGVKYAHFKDPAGNGWELQQTFKGHL
ncbi:MAG: Glyoxalase [Sphingomonadales bacterium]|nr:Glyoxalase [Sphingomonadales bacterium]